MSRHYSARSDYPRREPDGLHSAPRRTAGAPKKTNIISSQDSYAACYFRDHPDVKIDTTDPKTKLQEFENSLDNYELDDNQKFQLLIRSKAMIYLIYGEDSPEAFKIHAKLGAFYNETHRPQSALRHLQKAHEISGRDNIDKKDLILVAVDTAEAHLALRDDNRQESQKHIQQANECIKQIQNYETDDLDLRYRCELVYARVISAGKHPEKSFKQYEQAMQTLREKLNGEPDTQLAKLYIEMCEVAQKIGDNDRKVMYAEQAYKTFLSLEMYASAEECAKKYPGPYSQSQATPSDMGYYDDAYLYGTPSYPPTYGADDQQQQHQEYGDSNYYASTTNENDQNYANTYNYDQQQDQQNYDYSNENQQQVNEYPPQEPQPANDYSNDQQNYTPEQNLPEETNEVQTRSLPTEEQNTQQEEIPQQEEHHSDSPQQEEHHSDGPHEEEHHSDAQQEEQHKDSSSSSDHEQHKENEQQQEQQNQSEHSDHPQEESHVSDHEEPEKSGSDHPQEQEEETNQNEQNENSEHKESEKQESDHDNNSNNEGSSPEEKKDESDSPKDSENKQDE